MISLHNIENALLNLSFDYSVIRDAVKSVDAYNNNPQECVTFGDVTLRESRFKTGTSLKINRISDNGNLQFVYVFVKYTGEYGITTIDTMYNPQTQTGNVIQFPTTRSL